MKFRGNRENMDELGDGAQTSNRESVATASAEEGLGV